MKTLLLAVVATMSWTVRSASLDEGFANPPPSAKPHTWYHMMNGNVTKEGITRDFEELAAAGIGGVQMFDAGCAIPSGPMRFNSPEWFDLLKHAMTEARRLGLEICLPNCSGWSSSGGPWNPASNAMKRVAITERRVKGGSTFSGTLAEPRNPCGYYRDIAILAVPVPPANLASYANQRFTAGKESSTVTCADEITACGYSVKIGFRQVWRACAKLSVEISRDGKTYEPYEERTVALTVSGRGTRDYRYIPFAKPVKLRGLRVTIHRQSENSPRRPADAEVKGLRLERKLAVTSLDCKKFELRGELEPPAPEGTSDQVVAKESVIDLTGRAKDGTLVWTAPGTAAEWALLRIGCAAKPNRNHPASYGGAGFEVDKLSAAAIDYHFEQYIGRLCRYVGDLAGGETGLNNILVDSYEVGSQNWTPGFERIFRERRGYDLTPYLPVLAGYVVGNTDETERFLWDFRRAIADLFAENYAGALAKKCHEYGLLLSIEPYGSGPFDNLQYGRHADIPMGEFWSMSKHPGYYGKAANAKYASYVGHVWGRPYIATESFTAHPGNSGAWLTTPELIKPIGDAAYADGINRIIYHRFVHQPWPDDRYVPGLTMGKWGMHFDRHNTWWPYAGEFLRYQTRCQFMLQQGEHVADVLFWCGEDAPNQGGNTDGSDGSPYSLPYGYDWDVCETEALKLLKVEGGSVVTPGGAKYRLLALPAERKMSSAVLAKVDELVSAGARIAGPVCPTRTPGLSPSAAIREIAEEAASVWRKGVMATDAATALKTMEIPPDVINEGASAAPQWDHRRTADADIYFVCRNNEQAETHTCSFRVSARSPELWDAMTGTRTEPRAWRVVDGRTEVTFDFETCGSVFVVFRDRPSVGLKKALVPTVVSERMIGGPWQVSFATKYEGSPAPRTFDRLVSWTESADPDLRYLSGSGTYVKTVEIARPKSGERTILDLGTVKNFAEVKVNGKVFPPLWKPPYRVDITDALSSGPASLSVKVTNLWPNRLIGDDALPPDIEWIPHQSGQMAIKEIPQWVKDGKKSPTGRHTFTTWRFWKADDPLLPSGLLGPVRILIEASSPTVGCR